MTNSRRQLLPVFLFALHCATAKATDAEIEMFARVHRAAWTQLSPSRVAAITSWSLKVVDGTTDVDACTGDEAYYDARPAVGARLWVRFDRVRRGSACIETLSSFSYTRDFADASDAENYRLGLISRLKAGGAPFRDDRQLDFVWRAIDSLTYYNLYTNVTPTAAGARAHIRLLHSDTTGASDDHLPFERGATPR